MHCFNSNIMQDSMFLTCLLISSSFAYDTLQQVHILFRHGDRTPDKYSYPNDPYINYTFSPPGRGQLTLLGKQQEYKLGQNLRKVYNQFLGKIYNQGIIEARSIDYDRTKMSLQLVLAGLWPPVPSQRWDKDLIWQPIPYFYDSLISDEILIHFSKHKVMYEEILKVNEVRSMLENHKPLFDLVSNYTGLNITHPLQLFSVYFSLYTQRQQGLHLPEWTSGLFPEVLEKMIVLSYQLCLYNNEMKQQAIGNLFTKIKTDIINRINGVSSTKLFLYSGHEYTVAFTLIGFNIYQYYLKVPEYGSYVTLELHNITNQYGIKLYYNDYTQVLPVAVVIPGCEFFCPIDKFFSLIQHITFN